MPEETGVNASSPGANGNASATGSAAGATDQTGAGGNGNPGPVPYDRFREVNERAKVEAGRAAMLEARMGDVLSQNQFLIQTIAAQRQPSPAPAGAPQPTAEEQALEQQISTILGDDQSGQQAKKAIDAAVKLAEIRMAKRFSAENPNSGITPAQVEQMVNERVGAVVATMQTKEKLGNWVTQGIISAENAGALLTQMQQEITKNPAWGQANNQDLLLNNLFASAVTTGQIKPFATPAIQRSANGSPLQPGGSGSLGNTDEQQRNEMAEMFKTRFPSLRNRDTKIIAKSLETSGLPQTQGNFAGRS